MQSTIRKYLYLKTNMHNSRTDIPSTNDGTVQHHPSTQVPDCVTASGQAQAQAEGAVEHTDQARVGLLHGRVGIGSTGAGISGRKDMSGSEVRLAEKTAGGMNVFLDGKLGGGGGA